MFSITTKHCGQGIGTPTSHAGLWFETQPEDWQTSPATFMVLLSTTMQIL
jgi:hypothetical protein